MVFITYNEYPQALISFLCCFFSMLWHSTKPSYPTLLYLDKFFVYSTVGLAIHTAARSNLYSLIPLASYIGLPYIIYFEGYKRKCFSFDPNPMISTRWHMVIHICNGLTGAYMAFGPIR